MAKRSRSRSRKSARKSYGGSSDYPQAYAGGGGSPLSPAEYSAAAIVGGRRRRRRTGKSRKGKGGGVFSTALVPLTMLGLLGAKQALGSKRFTQYKNKMSTRFRSTGKTLRRRFRR